MATSFDDIHDLFLLSVEDYRLDNLYTSSPTNFKTFLDGILLKASSFFVNCQKDLEDYNSTTRQFNDTLTQKEKTILSDLELMVWYDKKINDIRTIGLTLTDTDFKHYSEQQNLKGKVDAQCIIREKVNQDMANYGLKYVPWEDWSNGIFFQE